MLQNCEFMQNFYKVPPTRFKLVGPSVYTRGQKLCGELKQSQLEPAIVLFEAAEVDFSFSGFIGKFCMIHVHFDPDNLCSISQTFVSAHKLISWRKMFRLARGSDGSDLMVVPRWKSGKEALVEKTNVGGRGSQQECALENIPSLTRIQSGNIRTFTVYFVVKKYIQNVRKLVSKTDQKIQFFSLKNGPKNSILE